jgi:drug/metabolite transporter (DMT)-like permease
MIIKKNFLGAICLSTAASIWGGMYVASKYVLNYIPPFTLVWLRYAIAFVVLFAVLKTSKKKKENIVKKDWILIGCIGFVGYFISISCQFIGTKLSDAHTGALITSATPVFIVVFARLILKEALTLRKIISLFLAVVGVIIIVGWESNFGSYFLGSMILVLAAITWALLSILVKIASRRLSSLTITTYAILVAFIFTTPLMLWEMQFNDFYYKSILIILGILYLGVVSTAGAFFLWNKGMELMDAGIGSLFFFFQPVVGSLLGWALLKEEITISFFLGGALILTSVLIVCVKEKKSYGESSENLTASFQNTKFK